MMMLGTEPEENFFYSANRDGNNSMGTRGVGHHLFFFELSGSEVARSRYI